MFSKFKFEFDINSCKRNSMGIVLKRRDNAPIVKHVFGNVIEKIMIVLVNYQMLKIQMVTAIS